MRWVILGLGFGLVFGAASASAQSRFDGWAAAIIAADWRDSQGRPISAFDNARRDLTQAFQDAGFPADDMVSVTLRPDVDEPVAGHTALVQFAETAARATRGCLFYVTSHGSPDGIVFGPHQDLSPEQLIPILRRTCGSRPTVIVISACFSGVFVDGLKAPNRIVMTAARRDRSSFGCGEDATYPYFDGCVLEALPQASDFVALANLAKACVARRETEEALTPASEPQVSIGAAMQLLAPTLRFQTTDS